MNIKNVQLISKNLCYGLPPRETDEVEQHLTIAGSGHIWFSARNYKQYIAGKGSCRKNQVSIGKWKAEFLLHLLDNMVPDNYVTDYGNYILTVNYEDQTSKEYKGPLIGTTNALSYGKTPVSITPLLRRYIPIADLWAFSSRLAPDYDGKDEILKFAEKWQKKFASQDLTYDAFEKNFGEECIKLGFLMDTGKEFFRQAVALCGFTCENSIKAIPLMTDIDVLGSGVFSHWRQLTHWCETYELNSETCSWFNAALLQMIKLAKEENNS